MKYGYKHTVVKVAILIILFTAIAMGAVELLFLIDLGGIDLAVSFLLVYFATLRDTLIYRLRMFKDEIVAITRALAALYLFQPKVFVSHATASGILVAITCSALLASMMWLPAIYLSSGIMS